MVIVIKQGILAIALGNLYLMIYHNNDVLKNQLINQYHMKMQSKWKRININSVNGEIFSLLIKIYMLSFFSTPTIAVELFLYNILYLCTLYQGTTA